MTATPVSLACRVRRIIGDELGVDPDTLAHGDPFAKLGATDIQMIHIVMSVEDTVDAEATDDDAEAVKTVGQLIDLAERLGVGSTVAA